MGSSLRLLQWRQQAVQEVQEALQHTAVAQRSLADARQEHKNPGTKIENGYDNLHRLDVNLVVYEIHLKEIRLMTGRAQGRESLFIQLLTIIKLDLKLRASIREVCRFFVVESLGKKNLIFDFAKATSSAGSKT